MMAIEPTQTGTGSSPSADVPSNCELHAAAAAGSEAAWAAIVERYNRLVWKVVRGFRLDQASAEDVVQLTWTRLVEHIQSIRDPERLGGWLVTTARNEALGVLRRTRRVVPVADVDVVGEVASWLDPDALVAADEKTLVARAFAALDESDQELLLLLTADPPLSYAEIAAALDRPIGSIGPSRGRAVARLRRALCAEQLRSGVGEVVPAD